LLAYPIRDNGGLLVRLLWRIGSGFALMPVLLLFLAAYARISAYGLTEQRYLIVLIGVWAFVLAFLRIWRPERFDLRLVPGVLAISPDRGASALTAQRRKQWAQRRGADRQSERHL
jgi:Domain of unknown function (DUF4153)